MKFIPLTKGASALVDDTDFEQLSQYSWYLTSQGYAYHTKWFGRDRSPKHQHFSMHRQILGITDAHILVDHKNGNRLDNRRCNLRLSNKSTNGCNRGMTRKNSTGYKGVTKHGQCRNRWIAQIRVNNRNHYLGLFASPQLAAAAYDQAAIHHFGEYAQINAVESS